MAKKLCARHTCVLRGCKHNTRDLRREVSVITKGVTRDVHMHGGLCVCVLIAFSNPIGSSIHALDLSHLQTRTNMRCRHTIVTIVHISIVTIVHNIVIIIIHSHSRFFSPRQWPTRCCRTTSCARAALTPPLPVALFTSAPTWNTFTTSGQHRRSS